MTADGSVAIGDVLAASWATFRRRFWAHAAWNAAFLVLAVAGTCGVSCALVPVMAATRGAAGEGETNLLVLALVYVLVLALMIVLVALHQGVTLAITDADLRGEPSEVGTALGAALSRLPALIGALLGRILADAIAYALPLGALAALIALEDRDDGHAAALGVALLLGFAASYVLAVGWMLAVRAFLGLSGPCAQNEGLGALAALGRSARLLEGRRLQHAGLRIVWALLAIVLYVASYVPVFGLVWLAGDRGQPLVVIAALPLVLAWYGFALMMLSFDSVLEGVVHHRLTRPASAEEIARIFA